MSDIKLMDDKEVGELWRKMQGIESSEIVQLIRKLVEERMRYYGMLYQNRAIEYVLQDFGIDPATWSKNS